MTHKIYKLPDMPFTIGDFASPNNPNNLPNILPFSYYYDEESCIIKQVYSKEIAEHLDKAYEYGSLLGTPMNKDGGGLLYLEDFWAFVTKSMPNMGDKSVLEIGCGKGYLLKKFDDSCAKAIGIEPGQMNKDTWDELNVNVVNGFYPSDQITENFDAIVSFGVLEHIADDWQFMKDITAQLNDGGKVILAVPNCEEQYKKCDPSIFAHEHYSYHTMENLIYFLSKLGLKTTEKSYSDYGGMIYICAEKTDQEVNVPRPNFDIELYARRLNAFYDYLNDRINRAKNNNKTLGIYCSSRIIAALPLSLKCRFFDDEESFYNRYYPPFNIPIENMKDLVSEPVDELWIFSYYFADIIADKIASYDGTEVIKILKLNDMATDVQKSIT